MSTRNPFTQQKHCPVVERFVRLRGVPAALGSDPTEVAQKNRSEISDIQSGAS